ncbi:Putative uncharacterized protein [Moritella viscosa]|uniref:DUF2787 family protein n=1 Tax=Moritella viscosa TaxID=80854 RepID=UPI000509292E|nr:DUF2787 family protein [Moritella viscosa]CED58358.1 putative uncharacterized protein [Moritella viscosa]SHN95978.1 Putative uncharacterized protein [Moritella viscosa]SHO19281.1 Putative uncharacterized protein [Moritella viscosa]
MTIQINTEGLSVPVSKSFVELLATSLGKSLMKNDVIIDGVDEPNQSDVTVNSITFNFRSPDYTAEHGGYYPVEISIERQGDTWKLCYITDFSYVGSGYFTELAKNTDFDFTHDEFQSVLGVNRLSEAAEFYLIWEANFLEYAVNFDVFELTITHHD